MDITNLGASGIYIATFVLGAMHSLEPGHGKTVVAAYLVGSRGRSLDAIILGFVVTITHSIGIITLGVIASVSSRYFSDQALHGYLGIVSSGIILSIGIWMLKTRWSALRNPSLAHHHGHLFHSHAPHSREQHRHDDHVHHDDQEHALGSPHDGRHVHEHHGDKQLGLRGTILLGISGGIVPCPAALAILLASASVGGFGKGLILVLIFSLGLAVSLITLGLIVVNGLHAARKFADTESLAPKIAFLSAAVVTLVGVVTLYSSLSHFGVV